MPQSIFAPHSRRMTVTTPPFDRAPTTGAFYVVSSLEALAGI